MPTLLRLITLSLFTVLAPCAGMNAYAGLNVIPEAKHAGDFGLRVTINAGPTLITDNSPEAESRFRVRFYVNLDGLTWNIGDSAQLLAARNTVGDAQLTVLASRTEDGASLNASVALDDGSSAQMAAPIPLTGGWNGVEMEWRTGSGDGSLAVWLDGVEQTGLNKLANALSSVDRIELGLDELSGEISGSADFDDYEAREAGEIGVVCFHVAELSGALPRWPEDHDVRFLIGQFEEVCQSL